MSPRWPKFRGRSSCQRPSGDPHAAASCESPGPRRARRCNLNPAPDKTLGNWYTTLGNWYTTLLNAHGNPIEHYGDLDVEMSTKKLDQTGPIKQLMS